MCEAPVTVWVGKGGDARQVQTACHECKQCRTKAVLDWVGRCIAESKTALATHAATLTYGRDATYGSADHVDAVLLTYRHVQMWLKRLRNNGYPARYFVTGEYGGLKGRAHWHVMLFWQKSVPDLILDKQCVVQNHWDHGFSFYTKPGYRQVWYNCKYIMKDQKLADGDVRAMPRMSKYPPLGSEYFRRLAYEYAKQGISPQTLEYKFPEVVMRDGKKFVFRLADRSAELFLDAFIGAWSLLYGDKRRPPSQLVDDWETYGKILAPGWIPFETVGPGGAKLRDLEAKFRGPVTQAEKDEVLARVQARARHEQLRAAVEAPWGRDIRADMIELVQELDLQWSPQETSEQKDERILAALRERRTP